MMESDSASSYVEAVVYMSKLLQPPLPDKQVFIILRDNLLRKYKRQMTVMYPTSSKDFKEKLSWIMNASDDSEVTESTIDYLTAA